MSLKIAIALVIGVLAVWSVVSTTLWALGEEGPTQVRIVTVETP